jgi:hypothetical protein
MKERKEETMFETTRWRKIEESTVRKINTIEIKMTKDTNNPSEKMIDTIASMIASMKGETSKTIVIALKMIVVKKT